MIITGLVTSTGSLCFWVFDLQVVFFRCILTTIRLYQLYNYNNSKNSSNNSKIRLSGFDSNSTCAFTAIEVVGGDGYYNNL